MQSAIARQVIKREESGVVRHARETFPMQGSGQNRHQAIRSVHVEEHCMPTLE